MSHGWLRNNTLNYHNSACMQFGGKYWKYYASGSIFVQQNTSKGLIYAKREKKTFSYPARRDGKPTEENPKHQRNFSRAFPIRRIFSFFGKLLISSASSTSYKKRAVARSFYHLFLGHRSEWKDKVKVSVWNFEWNWDFVSEILAEKLWETWRRWAFC